MLEFYSKEELEEFLGRRLEVVDSNLTPDRRGWYTFDKNDMAELFEKVRELVYNEGQNSVLDSLNYCMKEV